MNNLYNEAFETYDLIVDWVIENHPEIISALEDGHMNIDWSYRLLRGMAAETDCLRKELDKACELLARNDILQINSIEEWHEWFDRYGHNKKG